MSTGLATKLIHVLIVDDSAAVRDGLTSILKTGDEFEVVGEAANGAEAIEAVARLAPDVVLMDAQMPVLDGVEATRAIKASSPGTKILFLSVHPMHLDPGLEAGADAAMLKDIGRDGLLTAIRELAAGDAGD